MAAVKKPASRAGAGKAKKGGDDEALSCITPAGIACFAHVWEPHSFDNKEPDFGLMLVYSGDVDLSELKKICGRALLKKWGDKAKGMMKAGRFRMPWRDAEEYSEYGEPFVEGNVMINAKSRSAPGVVNARAKPITNQMDFYSGCLARISVYAHAYDTNGNKGVTLLLNNVQKTGEGEKLSGARMNAEDEFDSVAGGEDDDEGLDDLLG